MPVGDRSVGRGGGGLQALNTLSLPYRIIPTCEHVENTVYRSGYRPLPISCTDRIYRSANLTLTTWKGRPNRNDLCSRQSYCAKSQNPPAIFTSPTIFCTSLAGQIPAVRGNLVVPQRGKTETGGGGQSKHDVTSRSRELPLDRRARRSDAARAVRVHRDKKRWSHRGTNHNSERGSEPGSDGLTRPCGSRANREGASSVIQALRERCSGGRPVVVLLHGAGTQQDSGPEVSVNSEDRGPHVKNRGCWHRVLPAPISLDWVWSPCTTHDRGQTTRLSCQPLQPQPQLGETLQGGRQRGPPRVAHSAK